MYSFYANNLMIHGLMILFLPLNLYLFRHKHKWLESNNHTGAKSMATVHWDMTRLPLTFLTNFMPVKYSKHCPSG